MGEETSKEGKNLAQCYIPIWNRATVLPKPAHKLDIMRSLHFESKLNLYGNAVTM